MKVLLKISLLILVMSSLLPADEQDGFKDRPITNNLWMPTAHTLHEGEFAVGLGPIAVGINEQVQIETNILLFLFQTSNINLKWTFYKDESFAIAAVLDYRRMELGALNGDDEPAFSVISPSLAITKNISKKTSLHFGAAYSYFATDKDIADYKAEESSSGTEIMAGLDYSLSNRTKLMAEGGYDLTFKGAKAGIGVLFGWEMFRLKLGVSYFAPKSSTYGYTFPNVGLWWRFKG